MGFSVVLSPKHSADLLLGNLATGRDLERIVSEYPLNISPPTDDSPFFFHVLRLRDLFKKELWEEGQETFNTKAVFILGSLFIVILLLTIICILVPLARSLPGLELRQSLLCKSFPLPNAVREVETQVLDGTAEHPPRAPAWSTGGAGRARVRPGARTLGSPHG